MTTATAHSLATVTPAAALAPKIVTDAITAAARKFGAAVQKADPTVRRTWIYTDPHDHPGAIMGVMLERDRTVGRKNPRSAEVREAVAEVVEAIEAETHYYRSIPDDDPDEIGALFVNRVTAASARLTSIRGASAFPEYAQALALLRRRWLLMEGSYASSLHVEDCALVDAVLTNTRFDAVDVLWQIGRKHFDQRPTEAEFAAAMGAAS